MDVAHLLAALPAESRFPTVSEISARLATLARIHPTVAKQDCLATTPGGERISRLVVGNGSRHAVVIGMPHPNEPTGALGALHLARILCEHPALLSASDLTWHVIACADPDGTRLNESWFAGPFTLDNYATHIFRPPSSRDFEWTFYRADSDTQQIPADHAHVGERGIGAGADTAATATAPSTPGSRAVMELIDDVRPALLVSMHNAESGGLYAYAPENRPGLIRGFREIAQLASIPIDHGFAEQATELIAPGLFKSATDPDAVGIMSSTDYAARYGTFGVVVEPPLWVVPAVADTRVTESSLPDVIETLEKERGLLRKTYDDWLDRLAPSLMHAPDRWQAVLAGRTHLGSPWLMPGLTEKLLTVAELSSITRMRDLERLRLAGHVLAAAGSIERPVGDAEFAVLTEVRDRLDIWISEAQTGEFCGLGASVAAHVGMALTCAAVIDRSP